MQELSGLKFRLKNFQTEFDHRTSDSLMDSLTVDMVEKVVNYGTDARGNIMVLPPGPHSAVVGISRRYIVRLSEIPFY